MSVTFERLLTDAEVGRLLGGHAPATLKRWRSDGHGPRWVGVKFVRYRPSDVAAYIDSLDDGTSGDAA